MKKIFKVIIKILLILVISLSLALTEGLIRYYSSPTMLFIGHASVKLRSASGKVIYIDPYFPTEYCYKEPADYILITHGHSDHGNTELCAKKATCKIITWKEALIDGKFMTFDDGEVKIEAVPGGGKGRHNPKSNVGYVVTIDGVNVYHSADCHFTDDKLVLKDKKIDYALYTVNEKYTMGPEEATGMANYVGARVNIPIHGDGKRYSEQREVFEADGYMKLHWNQPIILRIDIL